MNRSDHKALLARLGAVCYIGWGIFHVIVAYDIFILGTAAQGMAQGRLYQLAGYMLCIALFAIGMGAWGNWRSNERAYWLNLLVIGWADAIWVLAVVVPGFVPVLRGLWPPAIYVLGTLFTTLARRIDRAPTAGR